MPDPGALVWAAERTHGAVDLATGTGLALDHSQRSSRPEYATWRSGCLGIDFEEESHGFADLTTGPDGAADARIHRLGGDGEVSSSFRLRHDPGHRRVDLLENLSAEFMVADDDDEDDPEWGWAVDASEPVTAHLATRLTTGSPSEQIFTAMASLHAWMFVMLDDWSELAWDHHWDPGPDPDQLWRPVDLGSGPSPFALRSGPPPVPTGPGLRQVRRATGPDGAGTWPTSDHCTCSSRPRAARGRPCSFPSSWPGTSRTRLSISTRSSSPPAASCWRRSRS